MLAEAFKKADHDGNAELDAQEVSDLVKNLHLSLTADQVLRWLYSLDARRRAFFFFIALKHYKSPNHMF